MRVVSLVPSWTETLIESNIEVVGRTRFCIHPQDKIKNIEVVGGTKDINWNKVVELKPDLLVLDREENPKSFADESKWPVVSTHIENYRQISVELSKLNLIFKSTELQRLIDRWIAISRLKGSQKLQLHQLPDQQQKKLGVLEWIQKPSIDYSNVVYVIWQKPWMAVTKETFIGSVLDLIGLPTSLSSQTHGAKYPKFNINDFDRDKTLFLFSSEPFPFHKKMNDLKKLNISSAVVNGECFSWFGLRALVFLENYFKFA